MKLTLFLVLGSALLALVAGFTKDDHEIFRLRDEIEATEGIDVTFYGDYSCPSIGQSRLRWFDVGLLS